MNQNLQTIFSRNKTNFHNNKVILCKRCYHLALKYLYYYVQKSPTSQLLCDVLDDETSRENSNFMYRPRHCQMTIRHQNKLPEFSDVLFWWTDHSVCYQFPFWPCMFVYLQIDLLWFKYPENNRSNLIKLADTWRKSLIKCFFLKKCR